MALRKVSVDVIFPVGYDQWTMDSVKWALCSVASQTNKAWRLHVVDATRSQNVRTLVEGIIPAERLSYNESHTRGAPTLNGLLYEAMCGVKARFVAYILPGTCWYQNHLERLMHEMEEGADVVFMSRESGGKRFPERNAITPGAAKLWSVMHRLAHYERTPGFRLGSEDDSALTLMRGFSKLLDTAWHPIIAQIDSPAPHHVFADVPLGPMKATQLALFQHA